MTAQRYCSACPVAAIAATLYVIATILGIVSVSFQQLIRITNPLSTGQGQAETDTIGLFSFCQQYQTSGPYCSGISVNCYSYYTFANAQQTLAVTLPACGQFTAFRIMYIISIIMSGITSLLLLSTVCTTTTVSNVCTNFCNFATFVVSFIAMLFLVVWKGSAIDGGGLILSENGNLPSDWGISFVYVQFTWACMFTGMLLYAGLLCIGKSSKDVYSTYDAKIIKYKG